MTREDFKVYLLTSTNIPEYMHHGLELYVYDHIQPGGFLEAILCNNLVEAAGRADIYNKQCLPEYAKLLENAVPSECYGSKEKYINWLKKRVKK